MKIGGKVGTARLTLRPIFIPSDALPGPGIPSGFGFPPGLPGGRFSFDAGTVLRCISAIAVNIVQRH